MQKEMQKEKLSNVIINVLEKFESEPSNPNLNKIGQVQKYLEEKGMKKWSTHMINIVLNDPRRLKINKKNKQLFEVVLHLSKQNDWTVGRGFNKPFAN